MSNEFIHVLCLLCFANLIFIDILGAMFFRRFGRQIRQSLRTINDICSAFTVKDEGGEKK